MKKMTLTAVLILALISPAVFAQEAATSRTTALIFGGIGYGKVVNDAEPGYDIHTNNAEVLINYRFSRFAGVAGGLGFSQLSGNGFNVRGNFYHERDALKIPVVLTLNMNAAEKIRLFAHLGPYAQTVLKDRYSFLSSTEVDPYRNWNMGIQMGLGMTYNLMDHLNLGFQFLAQSDLTEVKSDIGSNSQRIKNLTSLGVLFVYDL